MPRAEAAELPVEVVDVGMLAAQAAVAHHVNPDHLKKVIGCESQWKITARGDHGLARGLAQIRSDYHPDISDTQADNPEYAVNYMASEWEAGRAHEWSCTQIMIDKGWQ